MATRAEEIAFYRKRMLKNFFWAKSSATLLLLCCAAVSARAQNYAVERVSEGGIEVIHLIEKDRDARVTVVPSLGNRAIEFSVHGKNVLFFPDHDLAAEEQKPGLNGVPFLAPWANRLSEAGYWADGKHYVLNPDLQNYSTANDKLPIHGLLSASKLWKVVERRADNEAALVTCRLEFWKYPELMEQWPFAQEYEMTYRLTNGELEVRTSIRNLSAVPMPVSIGFHPYYRLPGIDRDEWILDMPASKAVIADKRLIPTGEVKPSGLPDSLPLHDRVLDNGFTDLARDEQGRVHFKLHSQNEALEVTFGPKYQVAVIWEPRFPNFNPQFVCIEPMAAVTDALNLHHSGLYSQLESVAPGETWTESFWIKPSGL